VYFIGLDQHVVADILSQNTGAVSVPFCLSAFPTLLSPPCHLLAELLSKLNHQLATVCYRSIQRSTDICFKLQVCDQWGYCSRQGKVLQCEMYTGERLSGVGRDLQLYIGGRNST
jgi:hypothetical protein